MIDAIRTPRTRVSHSAWNAALSVASTRPKPCIPPMSWTPSIRAPRRDGSADGARHHREVDVVVGLVDGGLDRGEPGVAQRCLELLVPEALESLPLALEDVGDA